MQGKDFLYFLKNGDVFKYVDEYGNIKNTTTPKPLQFSPDSWTEVSLRQERNMKYWGFDFSTTIPLNFVEDGARILKYYYYTYGASAKLELLILEQKLSVDATEYGFFYDRLYQGDIDFTTYSQEEGKVTVNAVEGGPAKAVKMNENTVYEIPMDVPEAQLIKFDGIVLHQTGNLSIVAIDISKSLYGPNFYMPVSYLNSDGQSTGISFSTSQPQALGNASFADKLTGDNWFAKNDESSLVPIDINLVGTLSYKCTKNDPGLGFKVRLLKSTMVLVEQDTMVLWSDSPTVGSTHTHNINITVSLQPGERLYMEGIYVGGITGSIDIVTTFSEDSKISAIFKAKYKTTYVKALPLLYVFQKICEKMGIAIGNTASDILALNDAIVLVCGDSLRGLAGAKLKTSLSQFFNSCNVPLNTGLGVINNTLIMEGKDYWLNGSAIDLGEVSALKIYPATDLLFNTLKIGSPNQTYDNVNGRNEFNNTLLFTVDAAGVKELTLVSDYRMDSYGAEITRLNLDGKTTTDSSADNDIWFIKTDRAGNLDRSENASATGLIDAESVFNIGLSPKHCFRSHAWYIHSVLDKIQDYLRFQTAPKNADLVSSGIAEKADVLVSTLPAIKFHPVLFEFETIVPDDYEVVLLRNPVRTYSFTYAGITMTGIAMKSGMEPSTNKSQTFTLMADAASDLSQLIDLY